ncbi:MAG: electron transfer flavoprotein subunit beta [Candidatus Margulisbacteria bacterium GWF2_35_9]|nr:MAG: electron transfer flavoprotein subunit beta [Candidatus Margulisbacteria bacterium GWF2_35_9]
MHIVVCIKQVPDTNEVKINPETNTLIREGIPSIINPFDENAVEEALRIKEKCGGKVTVISMGPPQVESTLRDTLAMGVDDVLLISDRAFAGADTLSTSYTLGKTIEKYLSDYDLIIFGKQAIDGDTAQVGPGVAEYLNIPQMTYVVEIDEVSKDTLTVKRELEEGYEVVTSKMPAAITVIKGINEPRYPSLKGKMKAKSAQVKIINAADIDADPERIGLKGSPTWVSKIFTPPAKGNTEKIVDDNGSSATIIIDRLKKLQVI